MSDTNKDITDKTYGEVIRAAIVEVLTEDQQHYAIAKGLTKPVLIARTAKILLGNGVVGREIDSMIDDCSLVESGVLLRLPPPLSPREQLKRWLLENIPDGSDPEYPEASLGDLLNVQDQAEALSILGEMLAAGQITVVHYKGHAYVRLATKGGAT